MITLPLWINIIGSYNNFFFFEKSYFKILIKTTPIMKQITILATFFSIVFLTGCGTVISLKKPIFLVDAPADLTVEKDGEQLNIANYTFGSSSDVHGAFHDVTAYQTTGVKCKLKKSLTLDLKSGDKKGSVDIARKPAIGGLILEGIFTFGIGTIVDLITGGGYKPDPQFVDVPAVLNNKDPRTKKEMKKALYERIQ